jgi:hypothetical protein
MAHKKKSPYQFADGTDAPRCTEIINILGYNKQALIAWARKLGMSGQDPHVARDEAANLGTLVHKYIENHVLSKLLRPQEAVDTSKYSFDAIVLAQKAFTRYKEWEKDNVECYVDSEIKIVDEIERYGGMADIVFVGKDGSHILGDFKTSSGIFEDHIIQVSAYYHSLQDKYQCTQCKIIHISKKIDDVTEPINIIPVTQEQLIIGWEAFKHAQWLYTHQKQLKP